MKFIVILTCASVVSGNSMEEENIRRQKDLDEDIRLDTPGLIIKEGYPCEKYIVVTEDGYGLLVYRIPGRQEDNPPILLMHGLGANAGEYVFNKRKSLAFRLWDKGYDVWLGNSRGELSKHKYLKHTERKYWDFSLHESGVYDVPAIIDFITNKTKHKQIFYIGHSMGTTMFFIMGAERPKYNEKIRAMFAFAPVAYFSNIENLYSVIFAHPLLRNLVSQFLTEFYVGIPTKELAYELGNSCKETAPTKEICYTVFAQIFGEDFDQLNKTRLPVYASHLSAVSTKSLLHYHQLQTNPGTFQQFDYGSAEKNKKKYNQNTPPQYDISKITAPIALHYGENDLLASEIDTEKLAEKLPNLIGKFKVPWKKFNHADFVIANDVEELLYNTVYYQLNLY